MRASATCRRQARVFDRRARHSDCLRVNSPTGLLGDSNRRSATGGARIRLVGAILPSGRVRHPITTPLRPQPGVRAGWCDAMTLRHPAATPLHAPRKYRGYRLPGRLFTGCHMSFLDIDERLLQLLEQVEFDRSPLTISTIGTLRHHRTGRGWAATPRTQVLREFRAHCKTLVAVGACAINGGLLAQRNQLDVGRILATCIATSRPQPAQPRSRRPPELLLLEPGAPDPGGGARGLFPAGMPPSADAGSGPRERPQSPVAHPTWATARCTATSRTAPHERPLETDRIRSPPLRRAAIDPLSGGGSRQGNSVAGRANRAKVAGAAAHRRIPRGFEKFIEAAPLGGPRWCAAARAHLVRFRTPAA